MNLNDVPKDVIVKHVIPYIQEPLLREINKLKKLVTNLANMLHEENGYFEICQHEGGCFINAITDSYNPQCEQCETTVCESHRFQRRIHLLDDDGMETLNIRWFCNICFQKAEPSNCDCERCNNSMTRKYSGGLFAWNSNLSVWY